MASRASLLGGAVKRRAATAGRQLWRTARHPAQRRERVRGRIDSLRDAGVRFESIHPAEDIERRPARTIDAELPELFGRLRHHHHPEAFRAVIPNARIAGAEPIVLTGDLDAVLESTFDLYQLEHNPVLSARLPHPTRVRGPHACLVNQWCWAYFHWVLDTLPRASLLPLAQMPELRVVVPDRLSAFHADSLDMIGVPDGRRVGYDRTQLLMDELWFPSLGRTGNPPRWVVDWLRSTLVPEPASPPSRRLYVSRADAPSRRVENEAEVRALLERHGFEVVEGSGMPFAEQLRVFSEASVIVGPHGAGLVNSFAARDATLIEMMEPRYLNGCYYALADAAGHDYWFLMAESSGASDLRVDVRRLEATLEAAL
jgi:capsular polysaccharide biosynthesis protein